MKKWIAVMTLLLSLTHLSAKEYTDVCVQESKEIPKDALLIDVRTSEEFKASHAKNAINIPYEVLKEGKMVINEDFVSKVNLLTQEDYAKPLIVICRIGVRSVKAASALSHEGYESVSNIKKGYMNGWRKAGLPSER